MFVFKKKTSYDITMVLVLRRVLFRALEPNRQVRMWVLFFFSSRRRHTRCSRDWSSDVCSSDLIPARHREGNLWCGWGGGEGQDGVAVFNPEGKLLGRILLPERCANLCFGGVKRDRLFMAGSPALYSGFVDAPGRALSLRKT